MITLDYDCVIDFWNNENIILRHQFVKLTQDWDYFLIVSQTNFQRKVWYFLINRSFFFIWGSQYTNINKIFHYVKLKKTKIIYFEIIGL